MNPDFINRIQSYIPNEMEAFLSSLERPMYRGLRINPKKWQDAQISFPKTPFSNDEYYVNEALGNHPYHLAGLFYLQEPSASSAVEILDVQPDDVVLDLCAAPGGKSTQIAAKLDTGFLVANEFDKKRAQILLSNMERMGVDSMMVLNNEPSQLVSKYAHCFDRILVDAPCSGEGMMKKHDAAMNHWSVEHIQFCAKRQKQILESAYQLLKGNGFMVYSTCTYAKEENEDVMQWFLDTYPDMELVDPNVSFGRPGFMKNTIRIFPMDKGEGHFVAKLHKKGGPVKRLPVQKSIAIDSITKTFFMDQLGFIPKYHDQQDDKIYVMDQSFIQTKGLHCLRQGIFAGERIKKRFEPAHAFYMNAKWIHVYKQKTNLSLDEVDAFMHGLEIEHPSQKGYIAVCVDGYPFGFGKSDGKHIKNKIPKGLRLLPNSHINRCCL